MIYTITPDDMRRLEAEYMLKSGCPSIALMERAAEALAADLPDSGRVLFLCGFGQNGGDGYAAARLYKNEKTVWQLHPEKLTGDAKTNAERLSNADIIPVTDAVPPIPRDTVMIVDALFGTGLCRPVEGIAKEMIIAANSSGLPIIACDLPSGVSGLTGEIMGEAIRAEKTITFHRPKIGLYFAMDNCGDIAVADIGIKGDALSGAAIMLPSDMPAFRPKRLKNTHKGDYGRVLIVAGSLGMAGAAAICANAAVHSGAGLTTIAADENILPVLQILSPSAMCVPLSALDAALEKADVIAIGPGLGAGENRLPVIKAVTRANKPTVWDADALNILAQHPELRPQSEHNIFTPHPGEAARLGKMPIGVTVLKGAASLITGGGKTALNIIGTPAMAKGGSGDALTGIIAALYAKNPKDPFRAAQLGCLLHGMAGCAAAEIYGENNPDAFDLIRHIP